MTTLSMGTLFVCSLLAIMGLTFKVGTEGAEPIDLLSLIFFSSLFGYLLGVLP